MKVFRDNLHRVAYATDASAYREVPAGVAYPESEEDIAELISLAGREGVSLIPRAGGTSIAGQVVGPGIVVDVSRHMNRILEVNAQQRWVRVQPGIVRDELNAALKEYGLFFSPETSTSSRCCIGGMVGNNSCGMHSLKYGATRDHVLAVKGYLSDGSFFDTERLDWAGEENRLSERPGAGEGSQCQEENGASGSQAAVEENGIGRCREGEGRSPMLSRILEQLGAWDRDPEVREAVAGGFPDAALRRRSCGYAIDEALEAIGDVAEKDVCGGTGAESAAGLGEALCKLICGSEGTLCFITEIKLGLDPLPDGESMVLCAHCETLEQSFEGNLVALSYNPEAVELMDGKILELAAGSAATRENLSVVLGGDVPGSWNGPGEGAATDDVAGSGFPGATLIVEFRGEAGDRDERAAALEEELSRKGLACSFVRLRGGDVSRVWALRKAGLGVLGGMKGDSRPVGVVEDTAVAPERLPAYMADFRELMERMGLSCVYYGHIGAGELHLRPVLNLKSADGLRKFREVARETALLVRKHRGSLSGEHGDGRLRGEFIPLTYGQRCYDLMCELKRCWDPAGIFNAGKIVEAPPMDESLRYEPGQKYALGERKPELNYYWGRGFGAAGSSEAAGSGCSGCSGAAGGVNAPGISPLKAMMCSVEQCNGAADCRSLLGTGVLCPAFRVSGRDELQSTRARANLLREILTRGIDGRVLDAPELREVLESCLACKGCKSECPAGVDVTRLRSEVLQLIYSSERTPRRAWMVSRMAQFESLGSLVAPLYNFAAGFGPTASLIKKFVGFAPERSIPRVASRREIARAVGEAGAFTGAGGSAKGKVLFFLDEFTKYQEPELARKFILLLRRLGYEVIVPECAESGRAAISKGCLKLARKYADRNVRTLGPLTGSLAAPAPSPASSGVSAPSPVCLVGLEPSCILTFRDEYPDLVSPELRTAAESLASNALLYDEFLCRELDSGRISASDFKPDECEIWLHGHCHQKALVGIAPTARLLRLLPGAKVHVIPSSCCGMAGSFGYEKEHYRTSLAIGEMTLFPAIRKAVASDASAAVPASGAASAVPGVAGAAAPVFVAAPGTSCRQQILDGTGVRAVHPIEILLHWLR